MRPFALRSSLGAVSVSVVLALFASRAAAQLTDVVQTPNAANAGIRKTYLEQIGAGQGDLQTVGSSRFLIGRDPFRSIMRGRQLFQRKFRVAEGFGPRTNDGLGDIAADPSIGAGLTDSCAACHGRPHGSAGAGGNVFTRPDSRDAPHLFGLGLVEMLGDEITQELRRIRAAAIALAAQSGSAVTLPLTAKGIAYGEIRALPNGSLDTSGVVGVDADLRVRPFFAEGKTASIREFSVGALNAEMGMEAWDPILSAAAAGADVVTPSGMHLTGSQETISAPPATGPYDDPDGDGVVDEVPPSIVDHLEFYLLNYFKPGVDRQNEITRRGRELLQHVGCTQCHVPDLVIEHDRRVADVDTRFLGPDSGFATALAGGGSPSGFNELFAKATPLFVVEPEASQLPAIKRPAGGPFVVHDLYADLRRHDLGPAFHEVQFDGTVHTLFMTRPLWGVGSTAPYGHDGRSINLRAVILRHGGEAQAARDRFAALADTDQLALAAFLQSLVLFPPPDTASNLDPANPSALGFPQFGHGSIKLSVLFNDPADPE